MHDVTYSMGLTLDGYIVGPDGSFDWGATDETITEIMEISLDEIAGVSTHLMGRRVYETMLYWETAAEDPDLSDLERRWTERWNPLPKVVLSRSLTEVQGAARLATGTLQEEIERLKAEPGDGDIAIGGATLAAQAADLDLIDEYRLRVSPVLVGGGIPFFSHGRRRVDLDLVESRECAAGLMYLRYRVRR
ncbi:dihydrofolate reductase family protein [Aeromicrobium tamlense]|uniref:Dihydrofolate reductase n=1 Tax=Aeromicrobium tamlense TaxID=375541 RepID=A0A8I0G0V3_9ACTN|nr:MULTISPECIES: dihydrofolate reductase family protein [Aeromicrobium]MBD1270874.1 dihydrofolate reductase family protein [Aeromicrobium tamlense]NYI38265.1 dihydrofolate reductase [Aeromicrobium tamlense]